MTRFASLALAVTLLVVGCGGGASPGSDPTTEPFGDTVVIAALTDAVIVGTERAVVRLQQVDGYWSDLDLRIPLPDDVKSVESIIRNAGRGQLVDDLHLAMNHAAEGAAGEIQNLLMPEIARLKWKNPGRILHGKDNAASIYLRQMTSGHLEPELRPVIERFLRNAPGYVDWNRTLYGSTREKTALDLQGTDLVGDSTWDRNVYQSMREQTDLNPLETDLVAYTTDRALAGFFLALGKEEQAIRTQPEMQTTNALRKVFPP